MSFAALFWWSLGLGVAAATITNVLTEKAPCSCRRFFIPFFTPLHLRVKVWGAMAVSMLLIAIVGALLGWDPAWSLFGLVGYEAIGIAIHERDKIRRAAKALGEVVIDAFGRLKVHPVPTPTGV